MPPLPESAVVNLVCALALTSTVTERLQSFDDRVKIEYQRLDRDSVPGVSPQHFISKLPG